MKIVITVPCYQCENQIERNLREVEDILSSHPEIFLVMLIENRGADNTVAVAQKCIETLPNKEKYRFYQNKKNYGLGGSHKIAFELALASGATHMIFLHGDHQATAKDIPALIKKSLLHKNKTVLGARFQDLAKLQGYSAIRTYGNLALNLLYSLFCGRKIYDLGSGLNLFRLSDFAAREYQGFDNGFTFNMDLLLFMVRQGKLFIYEPIHWSTTDQRSNADALRVGLKTLRALLYWLLRVPKTSPVATQTDRLF